MRETCLSDSGRRAGACPVRVLCSCSTSDSLRVLFPSSHLSPSSGMKQDRRYSKKGKGAAFNPQNRTLVEHRQFGVWDLYVDRDSKLSYFPTLWRIEQYAGFLNDMPYLWRTVCDVGPVAWPLLVLYVAISLIKSLVPALNLWYVELTSQPFSETSDN